MEPMSEARLEEIRVERPLPCPFIPNGCVRTYCSLQKCRDCKVPNYYPYLDIRNDENSVIHELLSEVDRLREEVKKADGWKALAEERGDAVREFSECVKYFGENDEIGEHACCYENSLDPHRKDCIAIRALKMTPEQALERRKQK